MAAGEFKIDSWDVDGAGFEITELEGWRDSPPRSWRTERDPNRAASRVIARGPTFEDRTLGVLGKLSASSTANLVSNLDDLKSMADGNAERQIEFGDRSGKVFFGRFLDLAHTEITHTEGFNTAVANPYMFVRLDFLLPDPLLYDSSTSSVNGITTATAIPLGSAPTLRDLTLTITGAATNPTITYRDSLGNAVATFTIEASLGGGDTRVIDMNAGTIVDQSGANKIDEWQSGTDFPWALDPRDGVFRTSAWPTLEINAGTLDVQYRKSWL